MTGPPGPGRPASSSAYLVSCPPMTKAALCRQQTLRAGMRSRQAGTCGWPSVIERWAREAEAGDTPAGSGGPAGRQPRPAQPRSAASLTMARVISAVVGGAGSSGESGAGTRRGPGPRTGARHRARRCG